MEQQLLELSQNAQLQGFFYQQLDLVEAQLDNNPRDRVTQFNRPFTEILTGDTYRKAYLIDSSQSGAMITGVFVPAPQGTQIEKLQIINHGRAISITPSSTKIALSKSFNNDHTSGFIQSPFPRAIIHIACLAHEFGHESKSDKELSSRAIRAKLELHHNIDMGDFDNATLNNLQYDPTIRFFVSKGIDMNALLFSSFSQAESQFIIQSEARASSYGYETMKWIIDFARLSNPNYLLQQTMLTYASALATYTNYHPSIIGLSIYDHLEQRRKAIK